MEDFYEIKTVAANDPIGFGEASTWCRDIHTTDKSLVESLISTATELIEKAMNRVFVSRVFTSYFSSTCSSKFENYPFVEIRRSPLISVASIEINGSVLDSSNYVVKKSSSFSRILFITTLEPLNVDLAYPIEIEFTAGYATVPKSIITAIEQYVLFLYENRGDVATDGKVQFPLVTDRVVKQYKILNTYG